MDSSSFLFSSRFASAQSDSEVEDQFPSFFGCVRCWYYQRFQLHFEEPFLPVVLLVREDTVDVSLGHPAELFLSGNAGFLHPIDFILQADDGQYLFEPPWTEFDGFDQLSDLLIGNFAEDMPAFGRTGRQSFLIPHVHGSNVGRSYTFEPT